nr:cell division protein FtsZ [Tanacetum cinerariifolium]
LRLENIKAGRKGNLNIATEGGQADVGGMNRRSSAFTEGRSVEILEFLRKKGHSRYP